MVIRAVETGGIRGAEGLLRADDFVDVNRERCVNAVRCRMFLVKTSFTSIALDIRFTHFGLSSLCLGICL